MFLDRCDHLRNVIAMIDIRWHCDEHKSRSLGAALLKKTGVEDD